MLDDYLPDIDGDYNESIESGLKRITARLVV